jgi:hypothetical protein
MASAPSKKGEEKALAKIRNLQKLPENKKCFDCTSKARA